jgi:hypothetical protein
MRSAGVPVLAAVAVAVTATTVGPAHGGQSAPPCDPHSTPFLKLVAPKWLPRKFKSGFYVQYTGKGQPYSHVVVSLEPEVAGGKLHRRYTRDDQNLDWDWRWPLRLAAGDGSARIVADYEESTSNDGADACARHLERVVQAKPDPAAHVHIDYRREGSRMYVSGTLRKSARRPVLVRVFEGSLRFFRTQRSVEPHDGRFSTSLDLTDYIDYNDTNFFARAYYPGDVYDTWPWDNTFELSWQDPCARIRLRHPPGTRPRCGP